MAVLLKESSNKSYFAELCVVFVCVYLNWTLELELIGWVIDLISLFNMIFLCVDESSEWDCILI